MLCEWLTFRKYSRPIYGFDKFEAEKILTYILYTKSNVWSAHFSTARRLQIFARFSEKPEPQKFYSSFFFFLPRRFPFRSSNMPGHRLLPFLSRVFSRYHCRPWIKSRDGLKRDESSIDFFFGGRRAFEASWDLEKLFGLMLTMLIGWFILYSGVCLVGKFCFIILE